MILFVLEGEEREIAIFKTIEELFFEKRNTLTEFNSNNTKLLNVEETKAKIARLSYIQERLKDI